MQVEIAWKERREWHIRVQLQSVPAEISTPVVEPLSPTGLIDVHSHVLWGWLIAATATRAPKRRITIRRMSALQNRTASATSNRGSMTTRRMVECFTENANPVARPSARIAVGVLFHVAVGCVSSEQKSQ